ncbi:MAG TPA: hypothetical protein VHQ47_20510 [Phycisphaerae bacterium]|nr:hypothetical protein [Phycisphaerae bacterium]
MLRKIALPLALLALSACNSTGGLKNPFVKEKPFVATPVPADFAVIVDENHDTYYSRQHIRQSITAADAMSTTTYTTRRDFNDSISNNFSQETPLSAVQLQNMWNDVSRYNLMQGSSLWINWRSDADLYKRNSYTLQIRANGHTRTYTATNGFSGNLRPLMLQVEAVRLPISQNSNTPVVTPPSQQPPEPPAATTQPTAPDMSPSTPPTPPVSSGMSDQAVPSPATAPTITINPPTPAPAPSAVTPPQTTTQPAPPADAPGAYHQLKTPGQSSLDHSNDPLILPDPNRPATAANAPAFYGGLMIPVQNHSDGSRD